jgi:hypothetical protein
MTNDRSGDATRTPSPTRGYRFGTLALWLLVLLPLASLAHAQPANWMSYQQGGTRYYQGTDIQGGQWTGSSFKHGTTTYSDFTGPDGQHQHCTIYRLSSETFADCHFLFMPRSGVGRT